MGEHMHNHPDWLRTVLGCPACIRNHQVRRAQEDAYIAEAKREAEERRISLEGRRCDPLPREASMGCAS